jgi:phage-related minor tail protein
MESVNEIKEALSARSRTATLDELRDEGRKRVRLIRAEHVAQMISEAVHAAIEHSGLLGQDEVDRLIEKSRQEFKNVLREREQEVQRAREVEEQLEAKEQEFSELKSRFAQLSKSLASTRVELEQARSEADASSGLPPAASQAAAAGAPVASPGADILLSLMQEMATLKASINHPQAPAAGAAAGGPADFSAALEKLAGTLGDRLDTLGKKMGVSSAVDGDAPIDFGGLFRDSDQKLESNMENIKVKQQAGGGIAANLARLKKLKGGG